MRWTDRAIFIVLVSIIPGAALAQDTTGYAAIIKGDYARAEQVLITERRIYPDRPALMINLAAIYCRTGRVVEARDLYRAVLARPDALMDVTTETTAWSHALAQAGLRKLGAQQLSSR